MDPDPDPGGPKIYGSDGSESATLVWALVYGGMLYSAHLREASMLFSLVSTRWCKSVFVGCVHVFKKIVERL